MTDERMANVGAGVKPTYHATESVEEAKAVVGQCEGATEREYRIVGVVEGRRETICRFDYLGLRPGATSEEALEAALRRLDKYRMHPVILYSVYRVASPQDVWVEQREVTSWRRL